MSLHEPHTGSDLGTPATRLTATHQVHGCALLLGTKRLLGNRYLLKRLLGRGGMSVVYLAEDRVADMDVALKVFTGRGKLQRESIDRHIRPEVRIARKVSHPHVCRVYDLGMAGEELFITMEYVQGRTLKDVLEEEKPSSKRAHKFVDSMLDALVAIHAAGVVHRDLKPSNVMVTPEDRVVVLDFGLAADAGKGTALHGVAMGTPQYCAPEQLRGEHATTRSDVFSFGLIAKELYERAYPNGIPVVIADVLAKCLAQDPEARFASAELARDAFQRAVARRRILSQIRRSVTGLFTL